MRDPLSVIPCVILCWLCLCAAPEAARAVAPADDNPAAVGFDDQGSEPRAIALADATLRAMGGRAAWDRTRYLTWRFFGKRLHVWDRWTGDVRIEYDERGAGPHMVILLNLNSGKGRAFHGGTEVTDTAALFALLQKGKEIWINDSYWLVMPYKLKDSGVTLRYRGEGKMVDGRLADVLLLTFTGVGVTPQNKYEVYVARDTGLVEQWAYYDKAGDPKPEFVGPWHKWRRYGGILLSSDHGEGEVHTGVNAPARLPASVFRSPVRVDPAVLSAPAPGGTP